MTIIPSSVSRVVRSMIPGMGNSFSRRHERYTCSIIAKLNFIERAEREFKTALAIDPSYGEAHFNLAVLYATWDPPQWEKARAEYDAGVAAGDVNRAHVTVGEAVGLIQDAPPAAELLARITAQAARLLPS